MGWSYSASEGPRFVAEIVHSLNRKPEDDQPKSHMVFSSSQAHTRFHENLHD